MHLKAGNFHLWHEKNAAFRRLSVHLVNTPPAIIFTLAAGEATGTHSQEDQLAHPNSWMDNRGSSDGTSTRGQRRYTAKNQGKRLHECHFCPYTSCRLFNLVMHKRIHTGEKPFKCSACPSAFTQPSNLKRHMQSKHTDKKPFACRLCSSAFRYKLQLEKHVERQHT